MPELDPVGLQIRWSRLITIMDEVDAALVRTSFSTIVGESRDFAVVMLDGEARSVAQSQLSSPAFTCSLPTATRHMLRQFPPETLAPGDVLVTNDPWLAHGHLPDLYLVLPLFTPGLDRPVAYLATAAHVSDIGGRLDELVARDLYEEGLRIPPSKLFIAGAENEQLFRIIEANVRVPQMVIGDIYAIIGSMQLGASRFEEVVRDYGASGFQALCNQILSLSETAMRNAIRAIPIGQYSAEVEADGYDHPIKVCVTITASGDALLVDYAGSSDQTSTSSINCVLNVTHAHTIVSFKASLLPDLPNNEGLFRPIRVEAPLGSIFNARFPAAVRARTKSSYHLHNALYRALSGVLPERVQAGSGSLWSMSCYGQDEDGNPVAAHLLPNGGKGAVYREDGLPTIAFPSNGTLTPVEIVENNVPLQVVRRELVPDSGGAGRHRGGLGQELAFQVVGERSLQVRVRPDKVRFPAPGICGGYPGAAGALLLDGQPIPPRTMQLEPGEELVIRIPGGGGFGDPHERNPEALVADLEAGYVSEAAAERFYGGRPQAGK
ncbi:MAG: N-methylhydantoinase [Thermomicrobiales bacterium]|nr:N-methylhydantoinase [Thermomicrobiales bacterium]